MEESLLREHSLYHISPQFYKCGGWGYPNEQICKIFINDTAIGVGGGDTIRFTKILNNKSLLGPGCWSSEVRQHDVVWCLADERHLNCLSRQLKL